MKFDWIIEESDIQAVKSIIEQQSDSQIVLERIERNINAPIPEINNSRLWQVQLMCLLTSQQRSGPNSPVSNLLSEEPFRLSIEKCKEQKNLMSFIQSTLKEYGGVRFSENIAKRATANLKKLERGGWDKLDNWVDKLLAQRKQTPNPMNYLLERQAAVYMDEEYEGFGPKQSRNFWQDLGLIRYEFVIDSRMTKWLRTLNIPAPISSEALSDEIYYEFLSDILRDLCTKAGVIPCVLDAAVFASYERSMN
jgi:thermostable 8-oxoguanine DNA glycosylase